jgi:dTDP-4-dehydrorhamnose 3,5-epimerase-like enzyme
VGVEQCRVVELPVKDDPAGDLAFAEGARHVPFEIARVFFVYDVPGGAVRGGHAHRALEQAVFCLSGSLDLVVDDGAEERTFTLDEPASGLYLPPMVWLRIDRFVPGTVYAVLASAPYMEDDYIRDRDEYLRTVPAQAAGG